MIQLIILLRRTLFLTCRLPDKWLHANYNSEAVQWNSYKEQRTEWQLIIDIFVT